MRFRAAEMTAALQYKLKRPHAEFTEFVIEQFGVVRIHLPKKAEGDVELLLRDPARAGHALLLADNIARNFFRQEDGGEKFQLGRNA